MWSFALRTLVSDRGKLITALVGVVFSVVLVNVQGGLFLGLISKASMLVDFGQADIWVGHRRMHNVDFTVDIPRRWIHRIRSVSAVQSAEPYLIGFSPMTLPSGAFELCAVVGVRRGSSMGNAWTFENGGVNSLSQNDGIIVDCHEDEKLENPQLNEVREIGGRRARVVAKSRGIIGFLVNPYVFTTYERASQYLGTPPDRSSYFLVKLKPGVDVQQAVQAIQKRVPELDVRTRENYAQVSVNYWMTRTGLGISFGAATLLGLFVGLVMVGQTLHAMVLDRLGEFGTLKAIGASERQVFAVLIIQAITMAFVGTICGLSLVAVIQSTFSTPQAPIVVPFFLSIGSFILVFIICIACSIIPYLRIRKLDPAMVLN